LEGLENILKTGDRDSKTSGVNPFVQYIEEADGIEKIENLQHHTSQDIYSKSISILETYFGAEEDSSIAPAADQQQYQFGSQVPQGGFRFA